MKAIAVLGPYRGGTSLVTSVLQALGVYVGDAFFQTRANYATTYECLALREACLASFDESPGKWCYLGNPQQRVGLLRQWRQRATVAGLAGQAVAVGGKHPTMCKLVDELDEAWRSADGTHTQFVCVLRSAEEVIRSWEQSVDATGKVWWPRDDYVQIVHDLIASRDAALQGKWVVDVDFARLRSDPIETIRSLADACGLPAERADAAAQLVRPARPGNAATTEPPDEPSPVTPSAQPRRGSNVCVVLVPVQGQVEPACEDGLRELERRGYTVWRTRGYAAIDQGRNQMATDALAKGFRETMWIDADIGFDPDDVDKLRRHDLPIVAGIYPKKGKRALAVHASPGTDKIRFGRGGGLVQLRHAATGFLYVHGAVYETIKTTLSLPVCNTRFGSPMIPFFQPLVVPDGDGHWYLAEDFAFCERAGQAGYRIMADTTIRLRHYGSYGYSWEDAGTEAVRYASYTFTLT